MALRGYKRGSIVVRNLQKIVAVDTKLLKTDTFHLRAFLEVSPYDVSVICVSKARMRNINKMTRNVDRVSEVLSFPYHIDAIDGKLPNPKAPCDYNLGDIYLCPPLINEKRRLRGITLHANLVRYVAHSLCHLIGYKHDTDRNWKTMFRKEKEILDLFSFTRGINIKPAYDIKHHIPQLGRIWKVPNL